MMADSLAQAQSLLSKMLRKQLFVVVRRFTKPEEVPNHLSEHLQWMIGLEKSGRLFAAGPFLDDEGKPSVGGMTIFRGESKGEIDALTRDDPFVKAGILTYEIFDWRMSEGRISVTVDFSDQSYELE